MNPNFKHIVKKLKVGSHKGGSPFPRNGRKKDKKKNNTYAPFTSQEAYDAAQLSNYTGKGKGNNKGKGKSREQAYQDRDMNVYGNLSQSEYNAEIDRQNAGGKVPTSKMKGSGSSSKTGSGGKKLLEFIANSPTPGIDKVNRKLNEEKNKKRLEEVTKKHYKDEEDRKAKEAFDNKTIKDHRADKRATRDKFRGTGKTDADKLEKIRSLGESKRGIKNIKENKKIAKLAARKGISEEEATKLRGERKQKGRDFWRNFASQLTHGVNVAGGGNFDTKGNNKPTTLAETMKANQKAKDEANAEKIEKDAGNEMRFDTNINKLNLSIDGENKNIQNAGYGLGSYSPKDYIPEWNTGSVENDYFNEWKKSDSLLNKLSDDEGDSTPQTAMRKIYNQKRGY